MIVKSDQSSHVYLKNTETGQSLVRAIRLDQTGKPIDIDLYTYAKQLNKQVLKQKQRLFNKKNIEEKQSLHSSKVKPALTFIYYDFEEVRHWSELGTPIKVTPSVVGPASLSYGNSETASQSFNINISASADVTDKIRAGAGFTWNTSASTNTSFGVTFNISSGRTGYVQFRPYQNVTYGTVNELYYQYGDLISKKNLGDAVGTSPIKLQNGFADGVFELYQE